MMLTTPLELEDSIASLGKSEFESVFCEELRRKYWSLLVRGLAPDEARIDADSVDLRIDHVDDRRPPQIVVTVVVRLRRAQPEAPPPRRIEARHTIVLDPEGDDSIKRPRSCHQINTDDWYEKEEPAPMPIPSAAEEAELQARLDGMLRKAEASMPDAQALLEISRYLLKELRRPHRNHIMDYLADVSRRLEALDSRKDSGS